MAYWVYILKKISLYVDEKTLEDFDSQLPNRKRSEVIRELMQHFAKMKFQGMADGIIMSKPRPEDDNFIIRLLECFWMQDSQFIVSRSGIIKVPTKEIVKANLGLGDLVKLTPEKGEVVV